MTLTGFMFPFRGILLKGNGWTEVRPSLVPICLYLLVSMSVAVARYRQTLD